MSKSIEFDPEFDMPTRREAVHAYIEGFDERDITYAHSIEDSLTDPKRPLAKHLILIPVAAHQEAAQIQPALLQYANQTTTRPFTVILGLNSPRSEATNPQIAATQSAIAHAKEQHPHLDVRSTLSLYDTPAIGMIRRDLWNGTLLASMNEGAYTYDDDDDIIGFNHDIDLIAMNPRYVSRVQEHYARRHRAHRNAGMLPGPMSYRSTVLKHAPSAEHPNVSKGAYWMDFITRQQNQTYEASLILPLSHYANKLGFNESAQTHETQPMLDPSILYHQIPGTTMATSPRRYIDRLRYGYDKIWTNESFGAQDTCRTGRTVPDISAVQLEAIISTTDNLKATVAAMASTAIRHDLHEQQSLTRPAHANDEIQEYELELRFNTIINKKIRLAAAVLERVIGSPRLAVQVRDLASDYDYKESITNPFYAKKD